MRERSGRMAMLSGLVSGQQMAEAPRPVGRPMGDVSQAMLRAAELAPGSVRELAARAQVGYGAARYTATRLVQAGALRRVSDERPAVLVAVEHRRGHAALHHAVRSFWDGADDAQGAATVPATAEAIEAFACL